MKRLIERIRVNVLIGLLLSVLTCTVVWARVTAGHLVDPGNITINMGVTRKFQVRENQAIEFRAEAFNIPDHADLGNPTLTLTNAKFGQIQSASDPRIMQLALKYVF